MEAWWDRAKSLPDAEAELSLSSPLEGTTIPTSQGCCGGQES